MAFRHPGVFGCDGKSKGRLKALGFVVDDPLCPLTPTRTRYDPKRLWDPSYLYIGRGSQQDGVAKSDWANPVSIKDAGSRAGAIEAFRKYLLKNTDLKSRIAELEGRKLMCHCDPGQECHADVLIEEFLKYVELSSGGEPPLPPGDDEVRAEAARRRESSGGVIPKSIEGRMEPTMVAGTGPPLYVHKGHLRRVLAEGGGLCSPGLWPPERRFEPEGNLLKVRNAICSELDELSSRKGGLGKFLSNIISGGLKDSPFPTEGTDRIRQAMFDATEEIEKPKGLQDQPIDVDLLHRLLALAGDPDAEIMNLYQVGVPIGVGVELPRTETVFPPKVKWSLKEQPEWGGSQSRPRRSRASAERTTSQRRPLPTRSRRSSEIRPRGGRSWS